MKRHFPSFSRLWTDWVLLGMESQAVIGLRLAKMARSDASSGQEARRMVMEKLAAVIDAQHKATTNAITGRAQHSAGDILRIYRREVRKNRRRLGRKT